MLRESVVLVDLPTVPVNVHRAGVSLAVVVRVDLGGVMLVRAVITAVAHVVLVKVKLTWVVQQRTVVLRMEHRTVEQNRIEQRRAE